MLEMAQGFGATGKPTVPLGTATSFVSDVECVIPMKYLSGFFCPLVEGMLIPAGLANGLRIEIQLVDKTELALIQVSGVVLTAFQVCDAVMLLE
jgi:hypothetical protein